MSNSPISLVIQSPRGRQELVFDKTDKVSAVIEAARLAFGFAPGNFTLTRENGGEVLAPDRPLVSFHLENGEVLLLIPEQGSGV